MRLELSSNNGTKYLRIVESISVVDPQTKKRVSRKKTIKNIGPISKFDDGKPDFYERLKTSFEAGDPIIEELKPYVKKDIKKEIYNLKIFEGTEQCIGDPKNISNILFEKILSELGVDQLIRTYKNHYGVSFDVYGFFKLMLFGRILNPASKISTFNQNNTYYEPIIKGSVYKYNIYDALDFIYQHRHAIFNRINSSMTKKYGRTTNYVYYDVTNFFFHIDEPDEDIEVDGIKEKGFRKMGVSKEKRKLPLVQMGLLMDEQGMPISMESFPGNTLDHQTLQDAFKNTVDSVKETRYIYVCDKGIGKADNLGYAVSLGNGYLSSKSVRGSSQAEKEWILDQSGYTVVNNNFKYKSKTVKKSLSLPNGEAIESSEKIVTYWSRNFYERDIAEKKDFYEFAKKLLESPESFRVTKTQQNILKKYINKKVVNTDTGEAIDSSKLLASLDTEKLKAEYELLGYYTLITSETNMNDEEIIETYHNLVEIEDQFRVMKSTLDTRPIWVRTRKHITAHLTVCFLALLMFRLIQRQIKIKHPELVSNVQDFCAGLSADRIQYALNKWNVEKLDEVYYRFNGIYDPDLSLILDSFDINIPLKLFKISELKHLKSNIELSI